MQAKARDDQALVKTLPSSRVGAQDIHLSKKVDNRFWNDKEPLVARQLSPLGGIETLSTSRPQNLALGGFYLFLSIWFFCWDLFHLTSWNTQSSLRDKNTQLLWTARFDISGYCQHYTYIATTVHTTLPPLLKHVNTANIANSVHTLPPLLKHARIANTVHCHHC